MQKILLICSLLAMSALHAQESTWVGPDSNNSLVVSSNWNPAGVPVFGQQALFTSNGASLNPTLPGGALFGVSGCQFTGNNPYTISIGNGALLSQFFIEGGEINNLSSVQQTFTLNGPAALGFTQGASISGSVLLNPTHGASVVFGLSPTDNATAGSAHLVVDGTGGGGNTSVTFAGASTAASSTIDLIQGFAVFLNSSSAQDAIINVNDSAVGFFNNATGAQASVSLINNSSLIFNQNNMVGALSGDATSLVTINGGSMVQVGSLGINTTIAGSIQGAGASLIKVGKGALTLSGINFYTGLTSVNRGRLILNGSIAGSVMVNNNGTLAGTGVVGGNAIVNSGGTISPGNSIGTLTVDGNYTQNSGSTYLVQINGEGQSSLIDIGGSATLNGGTVQVIPINGVAIGVPYHILHADGGVIGTFSALLTRRFTSTLIYQPLDVFLNLIRPNFVPLAATPNQRHVARQFNTLTAPNFDEAEVINALAELPLPAFRHALDLMSGEQATSLLQVEQQATRRFIRRLYDPLRELLTGCICFNPCGCDYGIEPWLQVEGGRSFLRGDRNGKGFKDTEYDISFGVQKIFNPCWTVGVAGDYSRDKLDYNLRGRSKVRTWEGALYGAYMQPDYYLLADIVGGYSNCTLRRTIHFSSINRKARSHPRLYNVTGYAEFGCNFYTRHLLLQPFVAIESGTYQRNRTREHRADSLNLIFKKKTLTNFDSRLGAHFTSCFCERFTLSADLAWQHRFNSLGNSLRTQFIDFGNTFTISGPRQGRDSIDGSIYAAVEMRDWLTLFAQFSGEKWSRFSSWSAGGGLEARF